MSEVPKDLQWASDQVRDMMGVISRSAHPEDPQAGRHNFHLLREVERYGEQIRDALHRLARPHPAPATDGESERLRAGLEMALRVVEPFIGGEHEAQGSAASEIADEIRSAIADLCPLARHPDQTSPMTVGPEAFFEEPAALAARPAVEHDRAIEDARWKRLASLCSPDAEVLPDGVRLDRFVHTGIELLADRQRARDGQSGGAQIIGETYDGVKVLAPAVPSKNFTREEVRDAIEDALKDSQYLAGVGAGWNAAQADDPNAALAAIRQSREGYLKPLRDRQRARDGQSGGGA